MTLYPYRDQWPKVESSTFIAPGARIIGQVTLGERSSVWFNAVLRGDIASINVGPRSNVQDNSTIHVDRGFPSSIGADVTIGHGVTLHGCTIEDRVLIGMGATLLNGCHIGSGSIIGANSLVTEGKVIPPRSLVLGSPGRVVRQITDDELEAILENGRHYVELSVEYLGLELDP